MTTKFDITYVFFRFFHTVIFLFLFYYLYKKYVKNFLDSIYLKEKNDETIYYQKKDNLDSKIKSLDNEINSEKKLKEKIIKNYQNWQQKIFDEDKKQDEDFEKNQLALDNISKLKMNNLKFSKNIKNASKIIKESQDLNDLIGDQEFQKKYLKKTFKLMRSLND